MSFFKKLKSKLFKSSSKLEEGLDAIVGDGGVEEELEDTQPVAEPVDNSAEIEAARQAEEARIAEAAAQAARDAEAADAKRVAEAEAEKRAAAALAEAEAARKAEAEAAERAEAVALAAQKAADARAAQAAADAQLEDERTREVARLAAEADAAENARKLKEAEDRLEEQRALAAAQAAEADRRAQAATEKAAKDAKAAEEAAAQAARDLETAKADVPSALDAPDAAATLADPSQSDAPAKKPGLFGRLLGRKEQKTVIRRELDDDMLEALEELLIASDMGVDTALRVTANMAEGRFGKKLSTQEIKELLAAEITKIMEPVAKPMPIYPKRPQVVLVVGVNGSGKTTTIGKLALQFSNAGKKVVIAAGDTFRAAAVEQLQVWGDRAGVPVLTAPEGSDPASLVYDAMTKAEADGADLLMIDTAGRLQNRADLMEELAKIVRVIRKKDDTAPHNTLLVLDATTGQNALNQVDVFRQISDVSGLVMTKLDGTAKGGVLVALADKFGLPIHAIGVGEQIDDLAPFDPEEFAQALTGAATE
ncbi:signal recognition particle-docking protein FtsY [Litoreibacter ascidiaceicola]|uniref:Signal recognition particle receptor FtsY n=1 Tax=Litoreibacter ascidiaceicola TaxID=1486859 RepID=A0A1M4T9W3_9RHOB|nr:signal recognition particle-docking protein FtsY [Litoreibacter ascidiaceicola]SHE41296.1 signal recognition particle-docking protein FtsY [Litoreibacter ascidiaceicola]